MAGLSSSSGAATAGVGTIWLRRLECDESTPKYPVRCRRGGGTRAASRAMRASGGISTDDVPSDHGFLNSSLTTFPSKILRRSLASGGRRMYLHKASRPCPSLAATLGAAGRLNPDCCPHRLPLATG